jgi:hypothetical protein
LCRQVHDLSEAVFRQRLSDMLAQGNYRCIAAYIGERMVGASGFWTGTQLWCGTKMMAWIEAESERTECAILRIAMVLGKDRTRQFYTRNGFFDDGLLMAKALARGANEFPEYVFQPD